MSTNEDRLQLFERWAADYDTSVRGAGAEDFPFAGYDNALQRIVAAADVGPGMRILDVGIGTGNLAALFAEARCEVWGVDFSAQMLKQAAEAHRGGRLVRLPVGRKRPRRRSTEAYKALFCGYVQGGVS